jgi:hypothetical protein
MQLRGIVLGVKVAEMARHYYLTRSGRLRRKDNTLSFEPSATTTANDAPVAESVIAGAEASVSPDEEASELGAIGLDGMGELALEPEMSGSEPEIIAGEARRRRIRRSRLKSASGERSPSKTWTRCGSSANSI